MGERSGLFSQRVSRVRRGRGLTQTLVLALLLSLFLGGCNLPLGRESSGSDILETQPAQDLGMLATLTQQAEERQKSAPTLTLEPTATIPPSPTAGPTQTPAAGADIYPVVLSSVRFRLGGTMAYLQGGIAAGEGVAYTFGAGEGQTLNVTVSSNEQQVYFEIKGLTDGSVLLPFSEGSSSFTGWLPMTQEYQVTLTSPVDSSYFLTIEIPANLYVPSGSGPYTIDGRVDVLEDFHPNALTRVRYLLDLTQGTTLDVSLYSASVNHLALALTGKEDSVPYLRHVVQSNTINELAIPVSQGYYLDVYAVSGVSADFSLNIEVSP